MEKNHPWKSRPQPIGGCHPGHTHHYVVKKSTLYFLPVHQRKTSFIYFIVYFQIITLLRVLFFSAHPIGSTVVRKTVLIKSRSSGAVISWRISAGALKPCVCFLPKSFVSNLSRSGIRHRLRKNLPSKIQRSSSAEPGPLHGA